MKKCKNSIHYYTLSTTTPTTLFFRKRLNQGNGQYLSVIATYRVESVNAVITILLLSQVTLVVN